MDFDNEIETRGFSTEWAKFFRRIFNRRTKFRSQRLEEEMKNLSSTLMKQSQTTETLTSEPKTDNNHEVCLFSESPHYIVRIAGTGNVTEFERLILENPSRFTVANPAGLCAAHNAALRNRVPILALIVKFNGDLNIEDENGWTPLHHAARHNSVDAIEFLLDNGVDDSRLNKQEEAAIHIAVSHNQLKALEILLTKRPEQANLGGERGKTPLHYAALIDNIDAAKILTDHKARLCRRCKIGSFPIHVAALNSSNRVFNHLFNIAQSLGYRPQDLLNFCDAENHRPLHSSVIGGNIEAVEICLGIGGNLDDQQDDLSTPVHLAAAQGSIEILKLMFNCQPQLQSKVLEMTDVQGMTPLHKAAMGDHTDVIEFLLDCGANIDARDVFRRTPLLVAALKSSIEAVCCLLSRNASLNERDDQDRNFLHFAIMQNLPMEKIGSFLFQRENYQILFDQRDSEGYYPIHHASREGQVQVLTTLIQHGAEINRKTTERQSSLHFAAQYGRYNTCRQLLDTPGFKRILNEPDKHGQTPLHLSCQNGHVRVVQLLLHKGAHFTKTYEGNTALHEAAANGHVATANIILQAHAHLINSKNRLGMTPLHLAAAEGHVETVDLLLSKAAQFLTNADNETFFDVAIKRKQKNVCLAIIANQRWREALDLKSSKYQTPLLGLIEHLPECVPIIFDRCITQSHLDPKNKDFHLTFHFQYINWMETKLINGKEYRSPMLPLNMMVKFGRTNHLSHPLCETLLRQKWLTYGFPIHMLNLVSYILFLALLSYFVITYSSCNHEDSSSFPSTMGHFCPGYTFVSFNLSANVFQRISIWFLSFYCFVNYALEIVQLVQDGRAYFSDPENYVQWTLYISTNIFVFPFIFNQSSHIQWVAGSISIFTGYLALLFLLGRFDIYGIYVIMFIEILKTLLHVLSLFSILIIGFGLTFIVIRPHSQDLDPSNIRHLFMLMLRTVSMMLGELDYERSYIEHDQEQHFSTTSLFILLLFAIIMPILLMNLLVGLAIGDLMQIQQNARLKRLATQVQIHSNLEKKLPISLIQRWTKNELTIYTNKSSCNRPSAWLKQWIGKPLENHETIELTEEASTENAVFAELQKQRRRQKEIQRQMEKVTNLVNLIVQKMEIRTETEQNNGDHRGKDEQIDKMKKFRQGFSAMRRFSRVRQ